MASCSFASRYGEIPRCRRLARFFSTAIPLAAEILAIYHFMPIIFVLRAKLGRISTVTCHRHKTPSNLHRRRARTSKLSPIARRLIADKMLTERAARSISVVVLLVAERLLALTG